jgi:hypothetical protein
MNQIFTYMSLAMDQNPNSKSYRPEPTQYDNGLETNLFSIAEQIFSHPPQPPCTIQLVMDHDIPSDEDLNDFEFQLLSDFTKAGLHLLFGQAHPVLLTDDQFGQLNQYINSIGYTVKRRMEETETSIKCHVSFERYTNPMQQSRVGNLDHLKQYVHNEEAEQEPEPSPAPAPKSNTNKKPMTPEGAIAYLKEMLARDPTKKGYVLGFYKRIAESDPEKKEFVVNLLKNEFGIDYE